LSFGVFGVAMRARAWWSVVFAVGLVVAAAGVAGAVAVAAGSRDSPRGARVVCGRRCSQPDAARALARGRWSVLTNSPLGARGGATVVWTGRELLELGGVSGGRDRGRDSFGAAAYDVTSGRWRKRAQVPRSILPAYAASVWTGHQVFMFGRPTRANEPDQGRAGLYDPVSNRWTVSSKAPIGPFANQPAAVWTGQRVILAGIAQFGQHRLRVAAYDPASNAWTRLAPPVNRKHPPVAAAIVATSRGVLLWSLWSRTQRISRNTSTVYSGVDVFRLRRGAMVWRDVTGAWPRDQSVSQPIFTGTKVLIAPSGIWCGICHGPAPHNEHGYLVDPRTLRLTRLPHGPLDDANPQYLWTGASIAALDFGTEIGGSENVRPGDIAFWNPRTRRWTRGPGAPKTFSDMPAVWAKSQLLVLSQRGSLLAYGPAAGAHHSAVARGAWANRVKGRLCVAHGYSLTSGDSLNGVAAVSHSRAWAVGWLASGQTRIKHWNGRAWTRVASANPGGRYCSVLNSVAVGGRNDVWAVGYYSNGTELKTLIEHWNGRAWKQVASPSPGGAHSDSLLTAAAVAGRSSAWAVGSYYVYAPGRCGRACEPIANGTLIEHWDGRGWKRVPSPSPGGTHGNSVLSGVAVSGAASAWAVGSYHRQTNHRSFPKTLVERWNGKAWRQVPSASPGCGSSLSSVVAAGSSSAWAVGNYCIGPVPEPLIERWNGRAWKPVPSPRAPGSQGELNGVSAAGMTSAWAVGYYFGKSHREPVEKTLIEHWTGHGWKVVASPSPGGSTGSSGDQSSLSSVSAASPSSAWAVGRYSSGNPAGQMLIERWTGREWKAVSN
jgi:hypothetical protein